ncbi:MAG: FMN-dependent NADH-azoreductase [Azospirillaceae bacterium]|nr:FMN-dependent NADH-azoreductase [Azospirillaceae bacterium]
MVQVLSIQSSPNLAGSISREISKTFVENFVAHHPGTTVVTRDLVTNPVPHLGVDLLGGLFSPPDQLTPAQRDALALSDALIAEIEAADVIVIGVPMHNFGIPSTLKAWVDHITRANKTFRYTEAGPVGLLSNKKVYLFGASGGVYSEGPYQAYDHAITFVQGVLGFLGLTDVSVVRAEGLALGPDVATKATAGARAAAEKLAA